MPPLYSPPPKPVVEPPVIVRPESVAVTFGSILNTRSAWFPSTNTRLDPGPSIVIDSGRVAQLELTCRQGDSLRRGEDARIKADRLGTALDVGQVDRPAQIESCPVARSYRSRQ